ncbi:hypothetical protein OUZ56_024541 [Daphnia magna]|uniref:Adhesive plaque matrix protein-like n=1 Tax=Daphnia magna TaxID=35525 RepID=A0ABR0B0X0_9CRUS|nr:hypothetical protein OUZ56_024541 [Daphnia magna]
MKSYPEIQPNRKPKNGEKATEYYTTATQEYYTKKAEYYTTTYAAPAYYTEAPKYYTTTYAAPAYYTEAAEYYTTKAAEYYTTTYAAPAYYIEAHKYYQTEAPKYYRTEAPRYYTTKAPEYTTAYAAPSYHTEAPKYYTTVYATPSYYTEAPNPRSKITNESDLFPHNIVIAERIYTLEHYVIGFHESVTSRPARTEIILLYYMIYIVTSAEGSYLSIQSCIAMGGQSHSNASPFEFILTGILAKGYERLKPVATFDFRRQIGSGYVVERRIWRDIGNDRHGPDDEKIALVVIETDFQFVLKVRHHFAFVRYSHADHLCADAGVDYVRLTHISHRNWSKHQV